MKLENATGKIYLRCLTLLSSALIFLRKITSANMLQQVGWESAHLPSSPFQGVTFNVQRSPGDSLGVSGMVLVLALWGMGMAMVMEWCWCLSESVNRFSH